MEARRCVLLSVNPRTIHKRKSYMILYMAFGHRLNAGSLFSEIISMPQNCNEENVYIEILSSRMSCNS